MQVSELMADAIEFIPPDATAQEAAELMGELDVGALPVGAPEDLQGVVTDRDLLFRVVAAGRDPARTRVREIMSSTVFTCRDTDTLETAMDMMAAYHVRRLPVRNEAGQIIGWVTLSDLARRLLLETGAIRDALGELTASAAAA